jgi:hypothetical protein
VHKGDGLISALVFGKRQVSIDIALKAVKLLIVTHG